MSGNCLASLSTFNSAMAPRRASVKEWNLRQDLQDSAYTTPISGLSHGGQLRKIMGEGFHAAGGLSPIEVFIRRMVAVLR